MRNDSDHVAYFHFREARITFEILGSMQLWLFGNFRNVCKNPKSCFNSDCEDLDLTVKALLRVQTGFGKI